MRSILSKYVVRALKTIAIGSIALYLGYHLIQGENGGLSYILVSEKLEETNKHLAVSKGKRRRLDHRVSLLRPDTIDVDMLAERARSILNYGRSNETVVFYD